MIYLFQVLLFYRRIKLCCIRIHLPTVVFSSSTDAGHRDDVIPFELSDTVAGRSRLEAKLDNILLVKESDDSVRVLAKWLLFGGGDFSSHVRESVDWETVLAVYPVEKFAVAMQAEQHDAEDDFRRLNAGVYWGEDGDDYRLYLGYAYEQDEEAGIDRDIAYLVEARLGRILRLTVEHRFDLEEHRLDYQEYKLWWDLHCWAAVLSLREREKSTDVGVYFYIKAFPHTKLKI